MEQDKETSREGGGRSIIDSNIYQEVVQTVLLFGDDTWVLSAEISKKLEGVHTGFLIKVMGKTAKW